MYTIIKGEVHMAKSVAKKKRLHRLRTTGKDVSAMRNEMEFSTHVRTTKTKKEKLHQLHNKHKKHFQRGIYPDGNAFYYAQAVGI